MTPIGNLGKATTKRISIFKRDGGKCYICGLKLTVETMSLDHQEPRFAGGGSKQENLKCCCYKCNNKKSCIEQVLAQKNCAKYGVHPDFIKRITKAYSYYYRIVKRKYEQ